MELLVRGEQKPWFCRCAAECEIQQETGVGELPAIRLFPIELEVGGKGPAEASEAL
jgi:hypothetical protein